MPVEIGVVVGQEGGYVGFGHAGRVSGVVTRHEGLLLQPLADVLDRVAAPDLPLFDHPARRHHAVGGDDAALLEDGALHND